MLSTQITAHASSATERLLLLLGWERVVSSSKKPHAKVHNCARDEAYSELKASVQQRNVPQPNTTDSSWERERPQLRMPAVIVPGPAPRRAESSWTPDAFEVGEHTGTV